MSTWWGFRNRTGDSRVSRQSMEKTAGTASTVTRAMFFGASVKGSSARALPFSGTAAGVIPSPFMSAAGNAVVGVAVQAGDLIIVAYASPDALAETSCTDTATGGPNSYMQADVGNGYVPAGVSIYLFYAIAKATETLTVSLSAGGSGDATHIHVVPGRDTTLANVLRGYAFSNQEMVAVNDHAAGPVAALTGDYVFSFFAQNYTPAVFSEAGSFTERSQLGIPPSATFSLTAAADGDITDNVTTDASAVVGGIVAAFKAASGGPVTVTGTSVKALALAGAIVAAHGVAGLTNRPMPFGGSAAGTATPPAITGTSTAALPFAGSSIGAHGVAGSTTQALPMAGSSSGTHTGPTYFGTSSQPIPFAGTAAGAHGAAGTSSKAVPFTGTAAGAHGVVGGSSQAFTLGGSTLGAHGAAGTSATGLPFAGTASGATSGPGAVTGSSSAVLPFTGTTNGSHGVAGASSAALLLSGSAAGTHTTPIFTGSSTALVPFSGSAAGSHGTAGTSSRALLLAGTATGGQAVTGTSSRALTMGGSAAGNFALPTFTGTSTAPLPLSGAASGLHGVGGASSASLPLLGSAQGTHGVRGASVALLPLGGSADGVTGQLLNHDPDFLLRLAPRAWAVSIQSTVRALRMEPRTFATRLKPRIYEVPAMASPINFSPKDPDEILDLGLDFTDLLASGETIASAIATVEDATGAAQASMVQGLPDTTKSPWVYQRVKGGQDGSTYLLRIKATTSTGLVKVGSKPITIRRGA